MPTGESRERGYTFLLVLFAVAALGLFAAQAGVVWQQVAQREREAELLAIGVEFARALESYRKASPDGRLPERLEDLVADRRGLATTRHLRRVYRDPFTGATQWGLDRAAGQIVGVFSLAPGGPLRQVDFPEELSGVSGEVESYASWVFRPVERGGQVQRQAEADGLTPSAKR